MNPEWRTSVVTGICLTMRQTGDYSACPYLSDALQEAGCPEGYRFDGMGHGLYLLNMLRGPLEKVVAMRLVAQIYSQETEKAVLYMVWFSDRITWRSEYGYEDDYHGHMDCDWAIQMGFDAIKNGYYSFGTDAGADYMSYSSDHEENRRKFFANWTLITGVEVPEADQDSITFRCAC